MPPSHVRTTILISTYNHSYGVESSNTKHPSKFFAHDYEQTDVFIKCSDFPMKPFLIQSAPVLAFFSKHVKMASLIGQKASRDVNIGVLDRRQGVPHWGGGSEGGGWGPTHILMPICAGGKGHPTYQVKQG